MAFRNLLFLSLAVIVLISQSSNAADLTGVQDSLSNHAAGKTSVLHTIKFNPVTSIAANGDLKIAFASEFVLTNVAASADVSVSGGGVVWNAVQDSDLNVVANVLTLGFSSGTLTPGNIVTVAVAFTKNPALSGNYNITVQTGPDGFETPTDSRTIPVVITGGDIQVSAQVPYPQTNPTITNIVPVETIVISSGATQVISFDITDVNNNDVDYSVTPSQGSISVASSPISPVSGTSGIVTVTFTYFADGLTGAQTIDVTADDNEDTGGGLVTYSIDIFII